MRRAIAAFSILIAASPVGAKAQGVVRGTVRDREGAPLGSASVAIHGTTLYNVTGFTFGRDNDTTDIYADVDASAPFDVGVR